MSRDCFNVPRDWIKVTNYCKRLGLIADGFAPNYTNELLQWAQLPELVSPEKNQLDVADEQERVKCGKGCLRD